MMAISNMQIRKHLWRLCAMMGILLTSPFTLAVCAQMAQMRRVTATEGRQSLDRQFYVHAGRDHDSSRRKHHLDQ